MDLTPIPSQTAGPFFHLGLTLRGPIACLVTPQTIGERLRLTCCVFDGDGIPVNDALLEIWQADADGHYYLPGKTQEPTPKDFHGFGRLATDENGQCTFETIRPGRVPGNAPGNADALQAPHISVSVFARGTLVRLATRIYFAGDPANDEDYILALAPAGRRDTLLAHPQEGDAGAWRFDIHLCGEKETVFFDV
ncbi:MAG TPA: protocatechuate 3,4-dioxygenase subunit alpha [Candidatus Saccharimonadales bacterium]|jgi:protocatechuate 3,4-dioxygenase alpha subunit|nr:protocatechuate 3,4-dioxygenase subunit alpha [Candidatus Saccharimonadales bacterium]